eukprot:m.208331 g.208331  ORF g.208331 m.208331 type:complete len:537 (+) comp15039_c0_seq2:129-1739(+)
MEQDRDVVVVMDLERRNPLLRSQTFSLDSSSSDSSLQHTTVEVHGGSGTSSVTSSQSIGSDRLLPSTSANVSLDGRSPMWAQFREHRDAFLDVQPQSPSAKTAAPTTASGSAAISTSLSARLDAVEQLLREFNLDDRLNPQRTTPFTAAPRSPAAATMPCVCTGADHLHCPCTCTRHTPPSSPLHTRDLMDDMGVHRNTRPLHLNTRVSKDSAYTTTASSMTKQVQHASGSASGSASESTHDSRNQSFQELSGSSSGSLSDSLRSQHHSDGDQIAHSHDDAHMKSDVCECECGCDHECECEYPPRTATQKPKLKKRISREEWLRLKEQQRNQQRREAKRQEEGRLIQELEKQRQEAKRKARGREKYTMWLVEEKQRREKREKQKHAQKKKAREETEKLKAKKQAKAKVAVEKWMSNYHETRIALAEKEKERRRKETEIAKAKKEKGKLAFEEWKSSLPLRPKSKPFVQQKPWEHNVPCTEDGMDDLLPYTGHRNPHMKQRQRHPAQQSKPDYTWGPSPPLLYRERVITSQLNAFSR